MGRTRRAVGVLLDLLDLDLVVAERNPGGEAGFFLVLRMVAFVSVMVSKSNGEPPGFCTVNVTDGMCWPDASRVRRSASPGVAARSTISGEAVVFPAPPPPVLAAIVEARSNSYPSASKAPTCWALCEPPVTPATSRK